MFEECGRQREPAYTISSQIKPLKSSFSISVFCTKKKKKKKKNVTPASQRYSVEFLYIYRACKLVHTKPLYSNAKLIAFWRTACILHDTGLEF